MEKKPHFKNINGIPTLIVEDKPFLALAGEIHNSSASSDTYMEENVWENVNGMNVNTVIAPVYWELIEAQEGQYTFESVRSLINQARENQKKLILLWFGLWKNGMSTYVPGWMKVDSENYPFIEKTSGERIYAITPLCEAAVMKDATAFQQLMRFIKEYDSDQQTVIMVQVENEVGALGTDFDYSQKAQEGLKKAVPKEALKANCDQGTWEECFGQEAKEYFMAYHYAKALDKIAGFGKKEYDLPYFVNTWLEKYPARPGEYPTGGPTARMAPFWKKVTQNIAAFAPDIYVPNFSEVCEQYLSFQDNLMIPETRQDFDTVANLLYGLSKYNVNCFSPFGIEDFMKEEIAHDASVLSTLAIDASAFNYHGTGKILSKTYELLGGMMDKIIEFRGTDKIYPFLKKSAGDRGEVFNLSNCELKVSYQNFSENKVKSAGFVIETDDHEFFVIGINVKLALQASYQSEEQIGIVALEEGSFVDNNWQRGRILNGDERYNIAIGNETKIYRIAYHTY